jgi:hypothetical protein
MRVSKDLVGLRRFPHKVRAIRTLFDFQSAVCVSDCIGNHPDIRFAANRYPLRPASLTLESPLFDGMLNLHRIGPLEVDMPSISDQIQYTANIEQSVSILLAHEFQIAAPRPFPRMRDDCRAHHVHIHVDHTVAEVPAILDHGAMVPILPEGTASTFTPVVVTGKDSFQLLHHATDAAGPGFDGDDVGVVRGQAVVEQRDLEFLGRLPQALAVLRSVTSEAEEERTVMAAMRQVVNQTRLNESIGSWQ